MKSPVPPECSSDPLSLRNSMQGSLLLLRKSELGLGMAPGVHTLRDPRQLLLTGHPSFSFILLKILPDQPESHMRRVSESE